MFWPLDPPPPGAQLESTYLKIATTLTDNGGGDSTEIGSVAEPTATNGVSAPPTAAIKG
jgi:chromodomain-helicase-DNA-binding protein 1